MQLKRDGQDAVLTVELDPRRGSGSSRSDPPSLIIVPPGVEREAAIQPDFIWTGPDTLEARFQMNRTGTYRTLVKTGRETLTRIIKLYEAWHTAEPGKGYDIKAAEWRQRLDQTQRPAVPERNSVP